MDYKEKYEMALERAKESFEKANGMILKKWLVGVFPELEESEDEKVRKWIIDDIRYNMDNEPLNNSEYKKQGERAIAWLEKQGEQKPVIEMKSPEESLGISSEEHNKIVDACLYGDKDEPKFKVGEWYVDKQDGTTLRITKVLENTYKYITNTGKEYSCTHYSLEQDARPWTIQDAKEGDVLAEEDKNSAIPFIAIYKGLRDNLTFNSHCFIGFNGIFYEGEDGRVIEGVHPSTKEQRDLLFSKMKEAGYEWDAEKKELKKITDNAYCSENCKYDNMLGSCEIEHIEHGKYYYCVKDYYAGGNKRASKGDVVLAKRGMSMMALGVKANEYFLPVYQMPNQEWSEEMYKMAFSNCHL